MRILRGLKKVEATHQHHVTVYVVSVNIWKDGEVQSTQKLPVVGVLKTRTMRKCWCLSVLPWRCKGEEGDSNPMAILDMFNKTTAMIGLDV